MPSSSIDRRRVEEIFGSLIQYLAYLDELRDVPETEFVSDPIQLGAAKYYLQVSIECCLDVANHLISRMNWGSPESMSEAFEILAEQGVVETDFLPALRRMARFRNRLVHLYWDIDAPVVWRILQENLQDFEHFMSSVRDYLSRSLP